jgi:hypothetical protein
MNGGRKNTHWVPILSAVVALAGITSGLVMQYINMQSEAKIKMYEVTFLERQKSYVAFTQQVTELVNIVIQKSPPSDFFAKFGKLEQAYYNMYPFFSSRERDSELIHDEIFKFEQKCEELLLGNTVNDPDKVLAILSPKKENLFKLLFQDLFAELIPKM